MAVLKTKDKSTQGRAQSGQLGRLVLGGQTHVRTGRQRVVSRRK